MKDIITDLSMTETKHQATEKWREYVAAEKQHKLKQYTDLKNVYNQIKQGRKVIDIFKVIKKGGVHLPNHHPKLAIAQITTKKVWCRYWPDGQVAFYNRSYSNFSGPNCTYPEDIVLPECLPSYIHERIIPIESGTWRPSYLQLSAPVPPVPPKYLPTKITKDYYILWEVDEWKMVPPTDPWLLRRITKTLFVVCAGWDLTELEKSVMHGRLI